MSNEDSDKTKDIPYEWEYGRLARKGNRKLSKTKKKEFSDAFDKIAENPKINDLDIESITGTKGGLRLRIGKYRALFIIEEESKKIKVSDIGPRGGIYKKLRRKR